MVAGGHPEPGLLHELVRVQVEVDPADQGGLALAAVQALARQVQRGQRRGAHGVDGEAGAGEVEEVGDPVGDARSGRAGADRRPAQGLLDPEVAVLAVHRGREHPDLAPVAPGQPGARVAGVLQGLPDDLQEQPLLRVHQFGVPGRDAEEQRVERGDVVEEGPDHEGVRAGPVRRNRADAVAALQQVVPEAVQVGCVRVAAADPDDRDVGALRPLGGLDRVGRTAPGRAPLRRPPLGEVLGEVLGDREQRRMAEEQRGGQLAVLLGEPGVEPGHQERGQPVGVERRADVDPVGRDLRQFRVQQPQPLRHGRGAGRDRDSGDPGGRYPGAGRGGVLGVLGVLGVQPERCLGEDLGRQ